MLGLEFFQKFFRFLSSLFKFFFISLNFSMRFFLSLSIDGSLFAKFNFGNSCQYFLFFLFFVSVFKF